MRFIFAHGAGADKDSDFLVTIDGLLTSNDIEVIRFNFPYMESRRQTGSRRPPDRPDILLQSWREMIEEHGRGNFFIGGKSMGGRIASLIANETKARGLICLGFPFHAPSQSLRQERLQPLLDVKLPTLIIQGTRDPMGHWEEFKGQRWPPNIGLQWLEDGDHSLRPRKSSGHTHAEHLKAASDMITHFIKCNCS